MSVEANKTSSVPTVKNESLLAMAMEQDKKAHKVEQLFKSATTQRKHNSHKFIPCKAGFTSYEVNMTFSGTPSTTA